MYCCLLLFHTHSFGDIVVNSQSTILLPIDGVKGILLGVVTILLVLVGLIYQLLGFHCMLLAYSMTTYDFIVNEQKKERERNALRQQKKDRYLLEQEQRQNPQREVSPSSPSLASPPAASGPGNSSLQSYRHVKAGRKASALGGEEDLSGNGRGGDVDYSAHEDDENNEDDDDNNEEGVFEDEEKGIVTSKRASPASIIKNS